ncbi:mandelate racemase/muconate lactonizing enzyme family protein [Paludisphaera borealis]|uniref:D-galactarolactone cycloisomerase n=1 Tax=Paludisphaera borealis TaxID=1387353 RepID=A0A1U7CTU7_9BACT|nr:mandelate racemase/muconate lactonizing enzyme family protein [Paludisphaera borealis]APW62364.1 D-galactarolactone cycloisomerase [Paludisphaera borealis]
MKITSIEVCPLTGATVDGGWPQGHEPQENLHTLVLLRTDEGLEGYGSCFTSGRLVAGAVELLWPLLRGESAVEPERVSETLRQANFWQGRGGSVEHAISGIDIALWDLMGKACGQPISRLLGGDYRTSIRPYGSILFDEPEPLSRKLEAVVGRGFRSIKLGWRPFGRRNRAFDELLVKTARATVGYSVELMVDAGGSEQFWPHGVNWARNTAAMLANYGIVWFEEPLPPDDLEGYIELTRTSPVPIAGGEVLTRRQSFRPWIERRAVDILQPDCTKNGGLSESRRIAWLAADHNVQVVPHGWNTAVGLAADLQFSAAIPVARYVEYLTPSAYMDELTTEPFRLDAEGKLTIPSGPGLGITIDPEKLKRFCPERVTFR